MRLVDSNVFVFHMAQDAQYGRLATRIVGRIEGGEEVVTSTLVISQVCGYLTWKKRPDAMSSFLGFLRSLPNFHKVDTTFLDFGQAQEFCIEQQVNWRLWDDVVIAVQMSHLKVDEIYSRDRDFDKIPGVRRVFV